MKTICRILETKRGAQKKMFTFTLETNPDIDAVTNKKFTFCMFKEIYLKL